MGNNLVKNLILITMTTITIASISTIPEIEGVEQFGPDYQIAIDSITGPGVQNNF